MKSTLFNMVAVLFTITLVASAGVGGVYSITKEPIAQAQAAAVTEALGRVLPPFEQTVEQQMVIDELPIKVITATDGAGNVVGYAVETATNSGFSGLVRLMVGFTAAGEVRNINVLSHAETPGLGSKMTDPENPMLRSMRGKRPEEMQLVEGRIEVKKRGGDVDALTAATISSHAYCDAVTRAWTALRSVRDGVPVTDSTTGATQSDWKAASAAPKGSVDESNAQVTEPAAAGPKQGRQRGIGRGRKMNNDGAACEGARQRGRVPRKGGSNE